MIFVTLGTTGFQFDRLLKKLDMVLLELGLKEKLIIQARVVNHKFNYHRVEIIKEFPINIMIKYLKGARLVITHASPAIIFLSLKYAKNQPLILTRLKKFNEHIDNHQFYFAQFFKKKELNGIFLDNKNVEKQIKHYLLNPQKNKTIYNRYQSLRLVTKLIEYTENI